MKNKTIINNLLNSIWTIEELLRKDNNLKLLKDTENLKQYLKMQRDNIH